MAAPTRRRTAGLTSLALIAFALNSILCRLALGERTIDAASFTTIRLCSGALALSLIVASTRRTASRQTSGGLTSALLLTLYAVPFSFAYLSLETGTGALLLFGSVQATMILVALLSGERPHSLEWVGLVAALVGLVYMVSPGLTAPPPLGSALMVLAGVAWGVYSLLGRGVPDPLRATTRSFVLSVPFALAMSGVFFSEMQLSTRGAILAAVSGAVTSGVGYTIWYAALRGLTAARAATVQLSVPVLAAIGGIIVLSEELSLRFVIAGVAILGGIGLALLGRRRPRTTE